MQTREKLFLKPNEEKEILQGFPWVFDNEILSVKNHDEKNLLLDGSEVEVYSKSGNYLGTGIYNHKSKITVRILSRNKEVIFDNQFFEKRIQDALDIRFMYYKKSDSYRLIFAEADYLPGLIVERYVDVEGRVFLVVQFLSLSAEIFRDKIISSLNMLCHPFGIYERSDVDVREKEGLEQKKGWIGSEHNPVITIKENGILLTVDLENGQKTGYFLDQKFNRKKVSELSKNKKVLDTFTHTGAFGLNAFYGGASSVVSVDISEEAVETVRTNIIQNKASKVMKAICADVFDFLKEEEKNGSLYDLIILDPPAFAKSAKSLDKAYGGYKEINLRAMRILKEGGILVTCSCSHFFDEVKFCDMLMHVAKDSHRSVQILEKTGAGPDHPVLSGYPKSSYLKCVIAKVN